MLHKFRITKINLDYDKIKYKAIKLSKKLFI